MVRQNVYISCDSYSRVGGTRQPGAVRELSPIACHHPPMSASNRLRNPLPRSAHGEWIIANKAGAYTRYSEGGVIMSSTGHHWSNELNIYSKRYICVRDNILPTS